MKFVSPLANPIMSPENDMNLRIPTEELTRALIQVGLKTKGEKAF
jgi:hypothetical protein